VRKVPSVARRAKAGGSRESPDAGPEPRRPKAGGQSSGSPVSRTDFDGSDYHRHFGPLFANIMTYSAQVKALLNIDFPRRNLVGRLDFYKTLVRFVAGVLAASGEDPSVNERLSAIAFNHRGLVKNEMLPFSANAPTPGRFSRF
jgi:hypothetical protein